MANKCSLITFKKKNGLFMDDESYRYSSKIIRESTSNYDKGTFNVNEIKIDDIDTPELKFKYDGGE